MGLQGLYTRNKQKMVKTENFILKLNMKKPIHSTGNKVIGFVHLSQHFWGLVGAKIQI